MNIEAIAEVVRSLYKSQKNKSMHSLDNRTSRHCVLLKNPPESIPEVK